MSDLAKLAVGSVSDDPRIGKSREKSPREWPGPNPQARRPIGERILLPERRTALGGGRLGNACGEAHGSLGQDLVGVEQGHTDILRLEHKRQFSAAKHERLGTLSH
jgi:hypothetical protein